MAASFDPKIDYLGRGVDGRTPPNTWLDALDKYSANKIWDIHQKNKNIEIMKVDTENCEQNERSRNCELNVGGSLSVAPHKSLQLGGKLQAKRDIRHSQTCRTVLKTMRVATMLDDTSNDPNILRRGGKSPTHYTKYERELSRFILEHTEVQQDKQHTQATTGTDRPTGKQIRDLKGKDPVARLDDYLRDLRARTKSDTSQLLWEELADACCAFLDQYKYTHYVYNLKLGASSQELEETDNSLKAIAVGVKATTAQHVDTTVQGGLQKKTDCATTRNETRGSLKDAVVTSEEVIEVNLKPVTELINKTSRELKIMMEALLRSYSSSAELGPLQISCRKLQDGKVHKIYWQVRGEHIHGMTEAEQASTFQIKRINKKKFTIVHKTEDNTKRYVTCQTHQPKSSSFCPLQLVRCTKTRDISFDLRNDTRDSVHVPCTEAKWLENSPFLVELPRHKKSLFPIKVSKGSKSTFITMVEHSEQGDAAQAEDVDSRLKNSEEPLQPQYTAASCASLDSRDHGLMLFYFEPAVGGALPGLTINCPTPVPSGISRVESDSGTADTELPCGDINSSSAEDAHEQDDIDCAFIDLVGDEYIFPSHVL